MVAQTKLAVLEYLRSVECESQKQQPETIILSNFVSNYVGKNYMYISKLFSMHEEKTIEKYLIQLRIERVKKLLEDGEFSLSQIATCLSNANVQYLSAKFIRTSKRVQHKIIR